MWFTWTPPRSPSGFPALKVSLCPQSKHTVVFVYSVCVFILLPSATCLSHSQQRRPVMTGLGARESGLGLAELVSILVQWTATGSCCGFQFHFGGPFVSRMKLCCRFKDGAFFFFFLLWQEPVQAAALGLNADWIFTFKFSLLCPRNTGFVLANSFETTSQAWRLPTAFPCTHSAPLHIL